MVALVFKVLRTRRAFRISAPVGQEPGMGELARIGIAIPEELLEEFDRLIERRGYTNPLRSVPRPGP